MNYKTTKINGKSIRVHRIIAEKKLGRPLRKGEIVHHKNENKQDNNPRNLKVTTVGEHNHHHFYKTRIKIPCDRCGKILKMRKKLYLWKKKHHHNKIYCSNKCSGLDQLPKNLDKLILSEFKKGKTLYKIAKDNNLNRKTVYTHGKKLKLY